MGFTVAILGRPNVGKSTLFNRLAGKRLAIVDDLPGVTRDRREAPASLGDLTFTIIDTAGLEDAKGEAIEARMRAQTEKALELADVAVFLIDARAGLTPLDRHFAQWLRKGKTPIILAANKCEGGAGQPGMLEAYALGLGDPVPLSAEHGEGLGYLYDALLPYAPAPESDAEEEEGGKERPIRIAVVGRPNAGKSTLVNRLIGEDRLITGPEAGLTRDAIEVPFSWQGRNVVLIDTAGMRKKANITQRIERQAVGDSLGALRFAQVVVLVVDANAPLERQDLTIAELTEREGRAIVLAVNKWDAVENHREALEHLHDRISIALPQVKGVAAVTLSALSGKGLDKLMQAVIKAYDIWNSRVSTSKMNRWLEEATQRHPPPAVRGRRLKLRYMTQVSARPPSFVIFTTRPEELPDSYMRYLTNGLRETFNMPGTPIRITLRKTKNPYDDGDN
ncbi:GTPase involved in ribosome synthesis and maintenance [Rhodospirillaceae bacterium LM-1]|nr:GTPase involved in ribosome synthesis and maintenance [Rhodospirillaceae bacterium LM-1]